MPLTPEDVSNKRFTTVRLREGYDMTEVDQFLDEVEAALATMTRENDELRSKLQTAQGGQPVPEPTLTPAATAPPAETTTAAVTEEPTAEGDAEPVPAAESAVETAGAGEQAQPSAPVAEPVEPTAAPVAALETLQVTTTAEASVAATRLLELAGRNADELVLEAQQQAEDIVTEARTTAESVESEARERAGVLDAETEERRRTLFGDIDREKADLDSEIANLRTFEREYRAQLKSYFEQQLEALDGHGEGGSLAEPLGLPDQKAGQESGQEPDGGSHGEVSRLQAILAEDDDQDRKQDRRQD